jgi:hypothetical protein
MPILADCFVNVNKSPGLESYLSSSLPDDFFPYSFPIFFNSSLNQTIPFKSSPDVLTYALEIGRRERKGGQAEKTALDCKRESIYN